LVQIVLLLSNLSLCVLGLARNHISGCSLHKIGCTIPMFSNVPHVNIVLNRVWFSKTYYLHPWLANMYWQFPNSLVYHNIWVNTIDQIVLTYQILLPAYIYLFCTGLHDKMWIQLLKTTNINIIAQKLLIQIGINKYFFIVWCILGVSVVIRDSTKW
jgi:hypothetical protein